MANRSPLERLKDLLAGPGGGILQDDGPSFPDLGELIASVPWESHLSAHFLVQYHDDAHDAEGFSHTLAVELERIHSQLIDFFHVESVSKQDRIALDTRFICFILHTRSARTFGNVMGPNVLFYLLDPKQDPEYLRRLRHELAHLVWGSRFGEAPPLFQEGLAVYAEGTSLPDGMKDAPSNLDPGLLDGIPSLTELAVTDNFWTRQRDGTDRDRALGLLYRLSGAWVQFLVDRWGWNRLKDLFLESEYRDADIVERFRRVYGQDLCATDREWRDHLRAGKMR